MPWRKANTRKNNEDAWLHVASQCLIGSISLSIMCPIQRAYVIFYNVIMATFADSVLLGFVYVTKLNSAQQEHSKTIGSCLQYNTQYVQWMMYTIIAFSVVVLIHLAIAPVPIDSCPPSAAYAWEWIGSALVQIMACRLFDAKPSSIATLGYCQLAP